MWNSKLYNEHICDICGKKLLRNDSELNYNNTYDICYEIEDYYNNTEFIVEIISESHISGSNNNYFNNDS